MLTVNPRPSPVPTSSTGPVPGKIPYSWVDTYRTDANPAKMSRVPFRGPPARRPGRGRPLPGARRTIAVDPAAPHGKARRRDRGSADRRRARPRERRGGLQAIAERRWDRAERAYHD